jgi:hypothetical protein
MQKQSTHVKLWREKVCTYPKKYEHHFFCSFLNPYSCKALQRKPDQQVQTFDLYPVDARLWVFFMHVFDDAVRLGFGLCHKQIGGTDHMRHLPQPSSETVSQ